MTNKSKELNIWLKFELVNSFKGFTHMQQEYCKHFNNSQD